MTTFYKGYSIIEDREPWAVKYDQTFKYFPTEEGIDNGNVKYASSLEEAKDEISEIVFLASYPERWAVDHSKSLSPAAFDFLSDALGFCSKYDARPLFAFDAP
jgi:hypothetical protein